ncbi:MAG: hypothetical protein ISQ11_07435 [Planctomycetes bacterium]|nr:hypothetical protein [Planctomycetota bacterium]
MKLIQVTAALVVLLASASCSSETAPVDLAAPAMPDSFWVEGPMADAVGVLSAKQSPSGSVVVVKGQVQDFGELATFRLVDSSLPPCTDQCPTPWDFCCEDPSDVAAATINVEFLDGDLPAAWGLKGARGLDHLTAVCVKGTLHIDEAGNTRLAATSIAKL